MPPSFNRCAVKYEILLCKTAKLHLCKGARRGCWELKNLQSNYFSSLRIGKADKKILAFSVGAAPNKFIYSPKAKGTAKKLVFNSPFWMERITGIEPATSTLARSRSTK